jgi:hypothetical protein
MEKNVAVNIVFEVWDSSINSLYVAADDSANMSMQVGKDGAQMAAGAGAITANLLSTGARSGAYVYAATQAEMNANTIHFRPVSTTANLVCRGCVVYTQTMRGTDGATLASMWTDAKAAFVDIAISTRNATAPPAMITAQAVRDAMKLAPTGGAPDAGSVDKHLDDIPTSAAPTMISGQEVRDAMKLAPTAGSPATGSVDKHLDDIPTNPYTGTPPTAGTIAGAVLDEAVGAHTGHLAATLTATRIGKLDNLDVAVSTRNATVPPSSVDIDTQLSLTHGAGSWLSGGGAIAGARSVTLTIVDPTGAPLPDSSIAVLNAGASVFLWSHLADGSGKAIAYLDDGAYVVRLRLVGYSFIDTPITVSGDMAATVVGTPCSIPAPPANVQSLYGNLIDLTGGPTLGYIEARTKSSPTVVAGGQVVTSDTVKIATATDGSFVLQLLQGAQVVLTVRSETEKTIEKVITVTAESTKNLSAYL